MRHALLLRDVCLLMADVLACSTAKVPERGGAGQRAGAAAELHAGQPERQRAPAEARDRRAVPGLGIPPGRPQQLQLRHELGRQAAYQGGLPPLAGGELVIL